MNAFSQKRFWMPTAAAAVLLAVLFAYRWSFYQGDHELLDITKACREQYICKIVGENVTYSREELGRNLEGDPESFNSAFYQKYHGMYEKGRPYYVLTPEEVMELVYSCGPEEDVELNWKNARWNTYTVYKDGYVEGRATPWPEVGTAGVRELSNL